MKTAILLLFNFSIQLVYAQELLPNKKGVALKDFYLKLDVENHWIAGHHVNWETGLPDDNTAETGIKTHCSAFVASACKQANVYILRPPEHKQILLSNAQFKWLKTEEAAKAGWKPITSADPFTVYRQAQGLANDGYIVVATCENPDSREPGHIALVMPHNMSLTEIQEEGPKLIMAGTHNHNLVSLKAGFNRHITSWPEPGILFYYNSSN